MYTTTLATNWCMWSMSALLQICATCVFQKGNSGSPPKSMAAGCNCEACRPVSDVWGRYEHIFISVCILELIPITYSKKEFITQVGDRYTDVISRDSDW